MAPNAVAASQDSFAVGLYRPSPAEAALVERLLPGVSRTFALTIPQLPPGLRHAVGTAYLLCRIADTIEDDPQLGATAKAQLQLGFQRVLAGRDAPDKLSASLLDVLSPATPAAVAELIRELPGVVKITRSLPWQQQSALRQCLRIMCSGMARFQYQRGTAGLRDQHEMDRYCYYVAGVVGQMLTELFCAFSPRIAMRRNEMMQLAVSFGQGLQMTNILKDFWDDRADGCCWLPREPFQQAGVDLEALARGQRPEAVRHVTRELIGLAHAHLRNALAYTLHIPAREQGIRRFCLWSIGLAVMTLRKLQDTPCYESGGSTKVSRRTVKVVIVLTSLSAGSDRLCRALFKFAARDLPLTQITGNTQPPERWSPTTPFHSSLRSQP